MTRVSGTSRRSIAIASAVAAAFCIETYIASGWHSPGLNPGSNQKRLATTDRFKSGLDLQGLIERELRCGAGTSREIGRPKARNQPSVWFSPYRQFPEVPPEGDDRGKGDYEYFSYLRISGCGSIASNYGTFKKSPADEIFQKASEAGLRSELLLAKRLGYELFVLDRKKIFLSIKDKELCKINHNACTETTDGFMAIRLKEAARLIRNRDFLLNSTRLGIGLPFPEALRAVSTDASKEVHWYGWENPEPGTLMRWSNGLMNQTGRRELMTPVSGDRPPANLTTSIVTSPAIKKLLVELECTRGSVHLINIAIQGKKDISGIMTTCLPRSIRSIRAYDQSNSILTTEAPELGSRDSRRSFYALEYRLR